MSLFVISALRAVVEMLGCCLIGQATLHVLAGQRRASNPTYQLFDLITTPPRRLVAFILPGATNRTIGLASFVILLLLWLGLALARKFI